MDTKRAKIAALTEGLDGGDLDARYLAFLQCFNQRRYFEAHEVLENLWLEDRQGVDAVFYKGLIQLAGAFVHLQKGRREPATALLRLAEANLAHYPATHHRLRLSGVRDIVREFLGKLALENPGADLLLPGQAPTLSLEHPQGNTSTR